MQIKFKGEITIAELRQLLFEKLHEIENSHSVRHASGFTLYFTPTNGFGDEIALRNSAGNKIDKIYSDPPYRSVADDFKI